MENSHPNPSAATYFAVVGNVLEHRFDASVDFVEPHKQHTHPAKPIGDLAQLVLDHGQSARDVVITSEHRFAQLRRPSAGQYRGEMPGVQVKREGQRLKRAVTPAPLRG